MIGLGDYELACRFGDIMTNQIILTEDGKLGIIADFLEKGTHVLEEYELRNIGLPQTQVMGKRFQIPTPVKDDPLIRKIKADYPKGIPQNFTLFKYGKLKYLEDFIDKGHFRIQPASAYDDPSLNPAIEDRELTFEKIEGHVRTEFTSKSDFYCFCSSYIHKDRLIEDFNADCVVVIIDPYAFFTRMAQALNEQEYYISFNKVTYLDPLLLKGIRIKNLAYAKHLRFTYQFEHRFVAYPKLSIEKLETRYLNVGSLNDIATIYKVE